MKKLMLAAAAFALLSSPALAMDADHKMEAAKEAVTTNVEAATDAATPAAIETKEAMLKDGTKIEITGDSVVVVGADGTKTPAPDAEHELADGTKVKTMGGKIVKDAVTPASATETAPAAQ